MTDCDPRHVRMRELLIQEASRGASPVPEPQPGPPVRGRRGRRP